MKKQIRDPEEQHKLRRQKEGLKETRQLGDQLWDQLGDQKEVLEENRQLWDQTEVLEENRHEGIK